MLIGFLALVAMILTSILVGSLVGFGWGYVLSMLTGPYGWLLFALMLGSLWLQWQIAFDWAQLPNSDDGMNSFANGCFRLTGLFSCAGLIVGICKEKFLDHPRA